MKGTLAAVAAAALCLAAPAGAQDVPLPPPRPLELSASLDQEQVEVGGEVGLTVRLKNTGTAPAEVLGVEEGALIEDRAVVSFDIQLDDSRVFTVTRMALNDDGSPRTDWPRATLQPGEAAELKVRLPAISAGTWKITAGYRRGTDQALSAPQVVAKVVPTAAGASEVEAVMITTMGPIRMRLFAREALGTALNFARLITQGATVQGKRRPHFYDGLTFHRVISGFMIQGGCPRGDGTGNPGWSIPAEFAERPIKDTLKHVPGRLSMARSTNPDSAGCQFFICVGEPTHLDGQYAVFGEVTRGLDVAMTIAGVEVGGAEGSRPLEPVRIVSMRLRPAGK